MLPGCLSFALSQKYYHVRPSIIASGLLFCGWVRMNPHETTSGSLPSIPDSKCTRRPYFSLLKRHKLPLYTNLFHAELLINSLQVIQLSECRNCVHTYRGQIARIASFRWHGVSHLYRISSLPDRSLLGVTFYRMKPNNWFWIVTITNMTFY